MPKSSKATSLAPLTALLLIGAALRLIGLANSSPPGLAHDEVANWLIDRSIMAGEHAIYFTQAYGHEAGFHYLQTLFLMLLGDHALAMRLPAAFGGLLGVAVCYALTKELFGRQTAVLAAAFCALLFWPILYSRMALRAIWLPVPAGLSALFWWRGWKAQTPSAQWRELGLAGLFAGLSLHIYMAARALPIFYIGWFAYLALFDRPRLRQNWSGLVLFTAVFAAVAAPLFLYLQANPGAEFRVAEVSAPLEALRQGDIGPVLANMGRIVGMFGWTGDPLWRQNVAFAPVFDPLTAVLFYLGIGWALWRFREPKFGFLLLWTAVSAIPSIVTINAPSTIRIILLLPLLTIFPAILIHNLPKLSTVFPHLSTDWPKIRGLLALTIGFLLFSRAVYFVYIVWPQNDEIEFVWQAAFTEAAAWLNEQPVETAVSFAGWSPDTMDPNTMTLLLETPLPTSHFNPQDGTLIIPAGEPGTAVAIIRPAILPLSPLWENQLVAWNAVIVEEAQTVRYTFARPTPLAEQPIDEAFGEQLRLQTVEWQEGGLVTTWEVTAVARQPIRLFVQALDASGQVIAESYHWDNLDPQGLWFPHWQPGDGLWQHHQIPRLPADGALRIGLFDPYSCTPGPCQNLLTSDGRPFIELPATE